MRCPSCNAPAKFIGPGLGYYCDVPSCTGTSPFHEAKDRYPNRPGWKARDTAKAAADAHVGRAPKMREVVLAYITNHGPSTPEQISEGTGLFHQSCRARCSELAALGTIKDSGQRGEGLGGRPAIKWEVVK